MPSVPYIRFYTDFPRHRKTMALRRLLGAYEYIVNLWCWAAENAPDGDLSFCTVDEIEFESRWTGEKGKALAAFVEVGFVDSENGRLTLHNWMSRTGQGVEQLVKYREKKKIKQRERRERGETSIPVPSQETGNVPGNETGNPITLTLTLSDPTSGSGSSSRDPSATVPDTATNLVHCLRVAVQREQPENGIWSPGRFFAKTADEFLRSFGESVPIEQLKRRIESFARDKTASPWTVSKFVDSYNAIGSQKRFRPTAEKPHPLSGKTAEEVYGKIT